MNSRDKILLGLSCHARSKCSECPYEDMPECSSKLAADMLALYQSMRNDTLVAKAVLFDSAIKEAEKYKRERDAALKGLARYRKCFDCKNYGDVVKHGFPCDGCECGSNWQWRGVEVG